MNRREAPLKPQSQFLVDEKDQQIPCSFERDGAPCPAPAMDVIPDRRPDHVDKAACQEHFIDYHLKRAAEEHHLNQP